MAARQREFFDNLKGKACMKFYGAMSGILFLDMLVFWILTRFYVPMPGTHAMVVMRRAFFSPFVMVSALQLIKLFLNVMNGYVVSVSGIKFYKAYISESPFSFIFGVLLECCIWGIMGLSVLHFLMHA
jgi:hypothetical protein